jgi:hypothetical protein
MMHSATARRAHEETATLLAAMERHAPALVLGQVCRLQVLEVLKHLALLRRHLRLRGHAAASRRRASVAVAAKRRDTFTALHDGLDITADCTNIR